MTPLCQVNCKLGTIFETLYLIENIFNFYIHLNCLCVNLNERRTRIGHNLRNWGLLRDVLEGELSNKRVSGRSTCFQEMKRICDFREV